MHQNCALWWQFMNYEHFIMNEIMNETHNCRKLANFCCQGFLGATISLSLCTTIMITHRYAGARPGMLCLSTPTFNWYQLPRTHGYASPRTTNPSDVDQSMVSYNSQQDPMSDKKNRGGLLRLEVGVGNLQSRENGQGHATVAMHWQTQHAWGAAMQKVDWCEPCKRGNGKLCTEREQKSHNRGR